MSDAGHGLTAQAASSRPPDGINAVAEADVRLQDVTKRFDDVTAVDRVTLDVYRGEFVSIIGPSGCGKTTTMRMIAGLDQPDAGEVIIRGPAMQGVPPYERNVALVFQSFALFPHLDVLGNVEFGLRMRGVAQAERRERGADVPCETVGYGGFERRRVGQLSGGQRQRVALARALVVEPALILLDEPLGSLDARLRIEMQSELKSLQQQLGITFIHVSHNQGEALAMADRIVVMNEGRFEQVDTPQRRSTAPRARDSWPSSSAPTTSSTGRSRPRRRHGDGADAPRRLSSSRAGWRCPRPRSSQLRRPRRPPALARRRGRAPTTNSKRSCARLNTRAA